MSNNPWEFLGSQTILGEDNKGIGAQFNRLLAGLELTSSQVEAASTRHTAMRGNLEDAFPGSKTFIVGSYAKNTSVRPPSDLDIFLVLPDSVRNKYNSYLYYNRNLQSELLQEVKNKIQKYYPNTTMKADGQVVIVPFASSFSVEIAPAFSKAYNNGYQICDTNAGGRWKDVDPLGEKSALTSSNSQTNGDRVKVSQTWRNSPTKLASNYLLTRRSLLDFDVGFNLSFKEKNPQQEAAMIKRVNICLKSSQGRFSGPRGEDLSLRTVDESEAAAAGMSSSEILIVDIPGHRNNSHAFHPSIDCPTILHELLI